MSESWQNALGRWVKAGLVDPSTADRVRAFEASRGETTLRWPVLIAAAFGAVMVAGGILLFVAAHWDEISPASRFSLVLLLVAIFHLAGSFLTHRFPVLSTALHGVGTAVLGAGIFLSGQIFNLQEHWPGGIMLWALGAWFGYALLRDWVQGSLAAILTPAWLAAEWIDATERFPNYERIVGEGLLLLALTYLAAFSAENRGTMRRALAWIGGLTLVPAAIAAIPHSWWYYSDQHMPLRLLLLGKLASLLLPLALAAFLRGRAAWMSAVAAVWVLVLGFIPATSGNNEPLLHFAIRELGPYVWFGIGSLGLIAWGMKESRRERINLGIAGFGIAIMTFYFSEVMDKLGRSASLIGFGLLFLVLGWSLERTRRRLVTRVKGAAA